MNKIILILLLNAFIFNKAQQVLPLSTIINDLIAPNTYIKDTDNQLSVFEGKWKGTWNNKTLIVNLKKIKYYDTFSKNNPLHQDVLIGRFQVKDVNGKILFDDLNAKENTEKIMGQSFSSNGAYQLLYVDPDLCNKMGYIYLMFTNPSKTEVKLRYMDSKQQVHSSCFYYGLPEDQKPEPFPKEIILTKQ